MKTPKNSVLRDKEWKMQLGFATYWYEDEKWFTSPSVRSCARFWWTLAAFGSAMSGPRNSFPWLEHSQAVAAIGQVGNEYCRAAGHLQSELPIPRTRVGEASNGANRCSWEELSSGGPGVPFFHTHKKCPFPLPAGKSELTTAFPFEMEKRNKNHVTRFWLQLDFHGACPLGRMMRILEAKHPCCFQHQGCCKNWMDAKNLFTKGDTYKTG